MSHHVIAGSTSYCVWKCHQLGEMCVPDKTRVAAMTRWNTETNQQRSCTMVKLISRLQGVEEDYLEATLTSVQEGIGGRGGGGGQSNLTIGMSFAACLSISALSRTLSASSSIFSEARRQGFSSGTPVSSPPSSVNGSVNKVKLK